MCIPGQTGSISGGSGSGRILPSDRQTAAPKINTGKSVERALGKLPKSPVQSKRDGLKTVPKKSISSLRGTDKKGVATRPENVRLAKIKQKAGLPDTFNLKLPPKGQAVDIDTRIIAKELLSLPKGQRARERQAAPEQLQHRIDNGFKVYDQVRKGVDKSPAQLVDIRDFLIYLTARASLKAGYFEQGAFNLPDPGNRIRDFLDSCNEVYQRKSTHIKEFTSYEGCGHRGIDIQDLPHGLGTLLYGAMKDGVEGTDGDRIFLKMEDHGCRFSGLSKKKRDADGPADRKRIFADLIKSLKHGWGGIKTKLGLQKTAGTRKERVPKEVGKAFEKMVKTAKKLDKNLLFFLNENRPADKETGHGIRTMMRNISGLLAPENSMYSTYSWPEGEKFQAFKETLTAFKKKIMSQFDHVEHRVGNEIVFDEIELRGNRDVPAQIPDYLSSVPIERISSFYLEQECGQGNLVIGKTASSLFKDGLPDAIDVKAASAQAKKEFEKDLEEPFTFVTDGDIRFYKLSQETVDLKLSKQFVVDFKRMGLTVNGQRLEGGPDINEGLQAFAKLAGGKEKAQVISKMMQQRMIATAQLPFAEDGKISRAMTDPMFNEFTIPQMAKVQEVTVGESGSVDLNFKYNLAASNGIHQCCESQVTISDLNGTPRVDDAKVMLMFVSPD